MKSLVHLATRLFNQPLMVHPAKFNAILHVLGPRLGFAGAIPTIPDTDDIDMSSEPSDQEGDDIQPGLALIQVHGTLVKRSTGMDAMSGLTTYGSIMQAVQSAMDDDSVQGLLFDFDSPGGESSGMFELASYLSGLRGQKPMYGVSNDSAYSAAYALASCMDKLYLTSVAGVGSIGVYMLHVDQSEADKQDGLKYTYISAGDKKLDGNPHAALSTGAKADAQAEVDRQRDMFVTLVAKNRNVTAQSIIDTQAGCYQASGSNCAVPMLADQVGGMDDAADDMCKLLGMARSPKRALAVRTKGDSVRTGELAAAAIAPHSTATSDGAWDGPAAEARLKGDQSASYYRKEYAWVDGEKDATKKNAYKFPHHEVSGGGDIGAANVKACQSIIGALNGARGGSSIPSGDRQGVYNHAARHLKDAKVDPAPLKSEHDALLAAISSLHELDSNPFATVAGMRRWATGAPRHRISFGYEGSDIELHLRSFQTRATVHASNRQITCLIAPYGQLSQDLGGFKEIYEPGCFTEALADSNDDPCALFAHDARYVIGCKSAGTARFFERADGLYFEADAPDTQWASDLLVSMRRGDIKRSSAGFFILRPRWEYQSGQKVRVIEKAKLVEGSVVSFAAYDATTAEAAPDLAALAAAETLKLEIAAQYDRCSARLRLLKVA